MKTTVEIPDSLLREAKRVAAKKGITLRALVEEGLRRAPTERRGKSRFRLRDASCGKGCLRSNVEERPWERIRDLIYKGHGS